jgi:hypothetical protein
MPAMAEEGRKGQPCIPQTDRLGGSAPPLRPSASLIPFLTFSHHCATYVLPDFSPDTHPRSHSPKRATHSNGVCSSDMSSTQRVRNQAIRVFPTPVVGVLFLSVHHLRSLEPFAGPLGGAVSVHRSWLSGIPLRDPRAPRLLIAPLLLSVRRRWNTAAGSREFLLMFSESDRDQRLIACAA